jgi:competence protein ComEA
VTPSERKALAFLSTVAVLGGVVRGAGGVADVPPPPSARQALARQIQAVDSAQRAGARSTRGRRASRSPRPEAGQGRGTRSLVRGGGAVREAVAESVPPRVDLDVATAAEIERLPRIGPALARRVVADRESLGAFGSLAGLDRVRGIGPGVAAAIRPYVTFSGSPRPSNAASSGRRRPRSASPVPSLHSLPLDGRTNPRPR